MKNKKKKIVSAGLIIGVVAGITFAITSSEKILENLVKSGTVEVESINLQLKDLNGNVSKEISDWEPGDVDLITWNVKNVGTAAVYTRNKIQIYWNEDVPNDSQYIYLYPANMSKEEIIEDFQKGEDSKYAIDVTSGTITLDSGKKKNGIEYSFFGDSLDGSEMVGKSKETNYNSEDFNKTTDDLSTTEDAIAFNILLSPKTTYLFGGKTITIKVVTEAMQYTDEGKAEWKIVDTQTIGD